jgi:hypothetical protein
MNDNYMVGGNKGGERSFVNNNNMVNSSRTEELKEILALIKEKVNMVEKSLERKDGQIRDLEEIIK